MIRKVAMQDKETQKWKFVIIMNDQVMPHGACEHCIGHDTRQEAYDHEKKRRLSEELIILGPKKEKWPKYKCSVPGCETEATFEMKFRGEFDSHEVCKEHATAEIADKLLVVRESWGS